MLGKSNKNEKYYIGSTIQNLKKRFKDHKNQMNNSYRQSKLYIEMRNIDINKWHIISLKEIQIDNKIELLQYENNYININDDNCLNINNSCKKYDKKENIKTKNDVIDINNEKYKKTLIIEKERARKKRDEIKNNENEYNNYLEYHKERMKNYRIRLKKDEQKYKIYLEKEKNRKKKNSEFRELNACDKVINGSRQAMKI